MKAASSDDPFADGSYYGYTTRPGDVVAEGLVPTGSEATFVAPDVIDGMPPGPADPIGPPEAGLPPAVPPSTYARPQFGSGFANEEWHLLPGDVLFRSFIAGMHAPRMAGEIVTDDEQGTLLDTTIGGRLALFRKGTIGPNAQGWEVQVYAASLTRLGIDRQSDVEAVDYSFGVPLVWRRGPTALRFGYDHLSSHVGDEFLARNPDFDRVNYVRDSVEFAVMQDLTEAVSVYGEANRTFHGSGGSEPWHFQFGAEYEPPPAPGWHGAPVAAVNTLLRQEFDYEGNLGIVAGWQWRGLTSNDLLRLGVTLYTGKSRQFSFIDRYEKLYGVGLWYDF